MMTPVVSMNPQDKNTRQTGATEKPTQYHYPGKFIHGNSNDETETSSTLKPATTTEVKMTTAIPNAAQSSERTPQMSERGKQRKVKPS